MILYHRLPNHHFPSVFLAAICSLARPWEAIIIGALGALIACPGCTLLERLRIDDPVGCVPTHGLAGIWGLISVALFAEKDILEKRFSDEFGIFKGGPWRFLGVQMLMVVAVSAWSAVTTFVELLFVDKLLGLRMTLEDELLGADKVEHGIEDHEPSLQSTYYSANENGQEAIKPAELNVNQLQISGESTDAMQERENGGNFPLETVHTRRKLLRLKFRRALSLKTPKQNDHSTNGVFTMKDSYANGRVGVNTEYVSEFDNHYTLEYGNTAKKNGSVIIKQSSNDVPPC